jgi:hypothetical protein
MTHITTCRGRHDVRGAIKKAGIGDVEEKTTVVAEDSGVEGFTSLSMNVGEELFGDEDIVNPVGASSVGGFFGFDPVAVDLSVGEVAGVEDFGDAGCVKSNNFVEVAHENNVGVFFVVLFDQKIKIVDELSTGVGAVHTLHAEH